MPLNPRESEAHHWLSGSVRETRPGRGSLSKPALSTRNKSLSSICPGAQGTRTCAWQKPAATVASWEPKSLLP